jgi:sugar-specific transcriptional regulator TrmB
MIKHIQKSLKELGFNHNEAKVYIALTQLGESTAAQVAKKADLPRTTVISILEKLSSKNYISTHHYKGVTFYWIESPRTIKESLLNRVKIADELDKILTDLYRSEAHFPHGYIYDTKSGIKSFVEKLLINVKDKSIICTIDSPKQGNYSKIYSENFTNTLNELKKKKGITTMTLVPHGSFETIDPEKMKIQHMVIREMPAEIKFRSSLWIVDGFVVLFSGNPPFISAVRHPAIIESTKSLFDFLWNISTQEDI